MRALCSNNQCFVYSFSALASPLCITFCILSLIVHSFIIHHRERFFSFVCVYSQPNGLGKIMRSSSPCSPRSWVGRLELSFSRIMTLTFLSADIFDQGFLLLKPSHCPCQSLNDQCVGKYYRKAHWAILNLFFVVHDLRSCLILYPMLTVEKMMYRSIQSSALIFHQCLFLRALLQSSLKQSSQMLISRDCTYFWPSWFDICRIIDICAPQCDNSVVCNHFFSQQVGRIWIWDSATCTIATWLARHLTAHWWVRRT